MRLDSCTFNIIDKYYHVSIILGNEATKPTMLSVVGTKYRDSYNNVFK